MSISAKARSRLPFGLCTGLSIALHVVVLGLALRSPPPRAVATAAAPMLLQGRLASQPGVPSVADAAKAWPGRISTASATTGPLGEKPSMNPPGATERPATAATPASPKAIPSPSATAKKNRPSTIESATEPRATDAMAQTSQVSDAPRIAVPPTMIGRDEYVPRPLLTVPPVAQTPVVIASPPGETSVGRQSGVLSLFIDEDGSVHHIAADEPLLPSAFELAAREAFMSARFKPGEVDGRVVKSRLRIEVVFENTPLAGAHR